MSLVSILVIMVVLCGGHPASSRASSVTAPQLQQMVSVVRYVQERVDTAEGAALLSMDERFEALLRMFRLLGFEPDAADIRPDMASFEIALGLLKKVPPERRDVYIEDAAFLVTRSPTPSSSSHDDDRSVPARGQEILSLVGREQLPVEEDDVGWDDSSVELHVKEGCETPALEHDEYFARLQQRIRSIFRRLTDSHVREARP